MGVRDGSQNEVSGCSCCACHGNDNCRVVSGAWQRSSPPSNGEEPAPEVSFAVCVATDGNNLWPGTPEHPLLTIQHGLAVAQANNKSLVVVPEGT